MNNIFDRDHSSNANHETERIVVTPPVPQPETHAVPPTQAIPTASDSGLYSSQSAAHTQRYPVLGNGPAAVNESGASVAAGRKKSMALPIISTAAITAILASAGTFAASQYFVDDKTPSSASSPTATQDTQGSAGTIAPIEHSTNQNPDWQAVTNAVAQSVVAIEVASREGGSQGSGVIIDTKGHIITNNHVVEGAENNEVTVTLDDGRIYKARITGLDAATDLAVIEIENPPSDLASATIANSDTVTVGSSVLAMGNPLGLAQTATTGIVSALDRPVSTAQTSDGTLVVTNAIQIDAAINPGNSGGPLFNAKGEVIGITSSIATMSSSATAQSGSIGLGFAIPSNLAKNIAEQLIANGKAEHAFLGVTMKDGSGTADNATRQGAVVNEVTSGSAAEKAGIKAGDVIVSVDGSAVTGSESLTGFVREHRAGDSITLGIIREGTSLEVTATLQTKTENATTLPEEQPGNNGDQSTPDDGSQGRDDNNQGGGDFDGKFDPSNPPSMEDLQELFEYFYGRK